MFSSAHVRSSTLENAAMMRQPMEAAGAGVLRAMRSAVRSAVMAAVAFAVLAASVAVAGAQTVDLLLVLASDVSRSVDQPKFQLQRDGYAAAITDARVLDAIRSGPNRQIAVCFIEWSGAGAQKLVIDWTIIRDTSTAQQFSSQLVEAPRSFADRTSISGGIEFAMQQLTRAPFQAARRTIDVSGDGTNNAGRDVRLARDEAVAKGITINGLVIFSERPLSWNAEHTNPPGGLDHYYRDNVIGGPGAFVMAAENFSSFGQAIISKMIAEVAAADHHRLAELPLAPYGTTLPQQISLRAGVPD
jgi:Protein of unknown function (DUF1194)